MLALLEWHWPARRGSRALQVLFVVYGLQAASVALFYFIRPEWVTPFASGGGSEPRSHHRWRVCRLRQLGSAVRLVLPHGRALRPKPVHRLLAVVLYLACWWLIVLSQTRATMAAGAVFLLIMLHANQGALRRPSSGSVRRLPSSVCGRPWCPDRVHGDPARRRTRDPVRPHRGFCVPSRSLAGITAVGLQVRRWDEERAVRLRATRTPEHRRRPRFAVKVLVDLGLVGFFFLFAALAAAWMACGRLYLASRGHP